MPPALILSSDSHVFEPPDLWTTRIDKAFRHRAPRMARIDGADQLVVEEHQVLSGIGLISNAGARFEAPQTISGLGRFEDVHPGGYDPHQHLADMRLDGVAGEVLYPSQGLFYFKVADSSLMSAIFRAYNDWLADFCSTDSARLKGIAMINLDDVEEGTKELERAATRGFAGAMITECPLEHRRYDQPEYESFWAAAQALAMPLSLHTATRRQGKIRGAGERTLRDATSRATKRWRYTSRCRRWRPRPKRTRRSRTRSGRRRSSIRCSRSTPIIPASRTTSFTPTTRHASRSSGSTPPGATIWPAASMTRAPSAASVPGAATTAICSPRTPTSQSPTPCGVMTCPLRIRRSSTVGA